MQFNFTNGQINDPFMFSEPPAAWSGIPVGPLGTFTQELQYDWIMSTTAGTNHAFSVPLTTLTWTWTKVDANDWDAN
jgi:hypothetical protein